MKQWRTGGTDRRIDEGKDEWRLIGLGTFRFGGDNVAGMKELSGRGIDMNHEHTRHATKSI